MRVIKFSATWCQPCKMLTESMKSWDLSNVNFEEVDIDKNRDAAMFYGIRSVPTIVVLDDNNNVLRRKSGLMTEAEFREITGGKILLG